MSLTPIMFDAIKSLLVASNRINSTSYDVEEIKQYLSHLKEVESPRSSGPPIPDEGDVREKRIEVMKRLSQLRSQATLYVSDSGLQQKIWGMLVEQVLTIYDVKDKEALEETLELANENLNQIESVIESYQSKKRVLRNVQIAAIYFSMVILAGFVYFLIYAQQHEITTNSVIELLGLPVPVILWSAIGSFAAILYRFSISKEDQVSDPLRWLFSRPLTGVVMGSLTYLIIKVGLMTFAPGTPTGNLGTVHLMWLVAYLAGLRDRFSDSLLRSMIGKFGGDKDGDIVSLELTTQTQKANSLESLLSFLGKKKQEQSVVQKIPDKALSMGSNGSTSTVPNMAAPALPPVSTGTSDKNSNPNATNADLARSSTVENTTTSVKIETKNE